jgi:hypothetical protein
MTLMILIPKFASTTFIMLAGLAAVEINYKCTGQDGNSRKIHSFNIVLQTRLFVCGESNDSQCDYIRIPATS